MSKTSTALIMMAPTYIKRPIGDEPICGFANKAPEPTSQCSGVGCAGFNAMTSRRAMAVVGGECSGAPAPSPPCPAGWVRNREAPPPTAPAAPGPGVPHLEAQHLETGRT